MIYIYIYIYQIQQMLMTVHGSMYISTTITLLSYPHKTLNYKPLKPPNHIIKLQEPTKILDYCYCCLSLQIPNSLGFDVLDWSIMDASDSPNLSESKRDTDEVMHDPEVGECENLDSEQRRVQVFDENDGGLRDGQEAVEEKKDKGLEGGSEVLKIKSNEVEGAKSGDGVTELVKVGQSSCGLGVKKEGDRNAARVDGKTEQEDNDSILHGLLSLDNRYKILVDGEYVTDLEIFLRFMARSKEEQEEMERAREEQERARKLRWREYLENISDDHRLARSLQDHELLENEPKLLEWNDQQLIRWTPSRNCNERIPRRFAPSLIDLCLKVLVDNAEAIVSLEAVSEFLKRKLSNLLCDSRRMNADVMDLFLKGSPEEIYLKDTSWITDNQFKISSGSFAPNNLRVLQFDLGGQCVSDQMIAKALARFPRGLPRLSILSLRGASRLTDNGLKLLVKLVPALCSINLSECTLLTPVGLNYLADGLGTSLRELYIDHCFSRIHANQLASALEKFEHLEVLSVARIPIVYNGLIEDIVDACGRNIKYLNLANCVLLTDRSLDIIGQTCSNLRALNIENLDKLTDTGLYYLAYGCTSIRSLKLCRNKFSDEAIAAFIDLGGRSLEELSLNRVTQVGFRTALSLARFSRYLTSLDLSWCRYVTDEALGLLVDNCHSLKLLKLYGCIQITNVFLDGHSNSRVRIIGLGMTPFMELLGLPEAEEYLRYSPLPTFSESEDSDDQDVDASS